MPALLRSASYLVFVVGSLRTSWAADMAWNLGMYSSSLPGFLSGWYFKAELCQRLVTQDCRRQHTQLAILFLDIVDGGIGAQLQGGIVVDLDIWLDHCGLLRMAGLSERVSSNKLCLGTNLRSETGWYHCILPVVTFCSESVKRACWHALFVWRSKWGGDDEGANSKMQCCPCCETEGLGGCPACCWWFETLMV